MAIEKRYEMVYDLDHADNLILRCLARRNNLITISRRIQKNIPVIDVQIILANNLVVAADNNYYFTNNQIRTCFNKFYDKNEHEEKQSYLKYLYGLMPSQKNLTQTIKRSKKDYCRANKTKGNEIPINIQKELNPVKTGDTFNSQLNHGECDNDRT